MQPAYQRSGVGTALLEHLFTQADTLGLPIILEASVAGAPLYTRLGFQEVHVIRLT